MSHSFSKCMFGLNPDLQQGRGGRVGEASHTSPPEIFQNCCPGKGIGEKGVLQHVGVPPNTLPVVTCQPWECPAYSVRSRGALGWSTVGIYKQCPPDGACGKARYWEVPGKVPPPRPPLTPPHFQDTPCVLTRLWNSDVQRCVSEKLILTFKSHAHALQTCNRVRVCRGAYIQRL